MRRKGHPSFPSAMTCCFFASLKTLLIPTEAIAPLDGVNVLALSLAGFQVTLIGRFWVIPEAAHPRRSQSTRSKTSIGDPSWCGMVHIGFAYVLRLIILIDVRVNASRFPIHITPRHIRVP